MKSDRILERLLALHPKLIDLSLGRILGLLAALGNPEMRLPPTVHVAGTNGKVEKPLPMAAGGGPGGIATGRGDRASAQQCRGLVDS